MSGERLICICGPTATGKTWLGIRLANALNGEIVSCDSMQIYKDYNIGTAKPTTDELAQAKHHLVGFLSPYEDYSVSDYVSAAREVIADIRQRDKQPIIVGGTGLYMRSLLRGVSFESDTRNDEVREALFSLAAKEGGEHIFKMLKKEDPEAAAQIHPNNQKRVIRALEYKKVTGRLFSEQMKTREEDNAYNYVMICLTYRDRQKLYDMINKRVDIMVESGLALEAKQLFLSLENHDKTPTLAQAIGYKELFPYFRGEKILEEAVDSIKQGTRNYAKRQLTWLRREENIEYICVDDYEDRDALYSAVLKKINDNVIEIGEK